MMLERLVTVALFLSISCGAVLLVDLLMSLYDRVLERVIPDGLADRVGEARGFEDWWEKARGEFESEGEALPPGAA